MTATLIRDELWSYPVGNLGPIERPHRRLRVWRTGPGTVTCVLTEELADEGMSITNAAEQVMAGLDVEYPDDVATVIEHYPHHPVDGPRYSRVYRSSGHGGRPVWAYVPTADLVADLPGLE